MANISLNLKHAGITQKTILAYKNMQELHKKQS